MNTNQGALYFGAGIDMNEWRRNITEMRQDILGLTQQTQRETQQMDSAFKNLSIGIGAYFSVQALQGFDAEKRRESTGSYGGNGGFGSKNAIWINRCYRWSKEAFGVSSSSRAGGRYTS